MKWNLVSRELLDPNSEKIEGFYKGDNFIDDIAFGACYLFSVIERHISNFYLRKFLPGPSNYF